MSAPKITVAPQPRPLFSTGDELRDALRRRSVSFYARMRVAEAIRAVAQDMVGDDDSLSAADRAWVERALDEPVTEATEEALSVLMQELTQAMRAAPARFRPSLAPFVTRTDFE